MGTDCPKLPVPLFSSEPIDLVVEYASQTYEPGEAIVAASVQPARSAGAALSKGRNNMSESGSPPSSSPPHPTSDAELKVKTGAALGMSGALILSLLNVSPSFYPRLGDKKIASVGSDEIVRDFVDSMAPWDTLTNDGALDDAVDLAKTSLTEAKQQTEYQDQKATRLLTVTTFLTALAGAFFANFASDFPFQTLKSLTTVPFCLLVATYIAFLLFVLFALAGALVTFHATRTQFKYPEEATVVRQAGPARSYLFFREMIGVTPKGWADSFVTIGDGTKKTALKEDLKVAYLKNYVSEAYLVAAKTADKLRYLQPAQSLLAWALRSLFLYIVLLAIVTATQMPTKLGPMPTKIEVLELKAPVPIRIEPLPPHTSPADKNREKP
jgi:hypothetical protein